MNSPARFVVDWEGSGEAAEFKNSGKLKLTLEKGRYANLQALQANIDATYSPDGLDVPTIFIGSDKMNLPGEPDRERFDAGNLGNPDRPRQGKVRLGLRFLAVRLEKYRNARASFPFGREGVSSPSSPRTSI